MIDVLSLGLDDEALFYVMGLEGCTRRPLKSDRAEALAIGRQLSAEAAEFLRREEPEKFIPRRCSVAKLRGFVAMSLDEVTPELQELTGRCQMLIHELSPPELADDTVPVEFVPHSLQLTTARRAYAILERPATIHRLLAIGGLLRDEVDAFAAIMPQVLEAFTQAVVERAMSEDRGSKSWRPPRMAKYQLPVLMGDAAAGHPEIAAMFEMGKAKKQAQMQANANAEASAESTPTQRRVGEMPSPKEAA
jgi:hypothetical protein